MLAKINKITSWQAALIIAVVGFAVYFTGLANPFQGDDITQIVHNPPVHSITHIKLFFEGGTFYNGHGLAPLSGAYFRPLMTTVFSLLYTVFGPHTVAFHLLQLLLCIGSAIILYLFFKYSFKPALALFLALIFLVHPLNSQVEFAIPSMQDALFFFFGILALYLLLRSKSVRSLVCVAVCLLLSLLSKESGLLFVAMALLYLFWWDKKRLQAFMGIMVLPIVLYIVLRIHAIGVFPITNNAPIDSLRLAGRLMTAPSIALFYIAKFIFPWNLSSAYYWVYPTFSVSHVLLPLVIDLAVVAFVIYMAVLIRRRASEGQFYTFVFFAIWSALGLLLLLQIVPLDMTASETWFYFPAAGLLGMIGVVLTVFSPRIRPSWLLPSLAILLIGILGLHTANRGTYWRSEYALAIHDVQTSRYDFTAYDGLTQDAIEQGNYAQAKIYVLHSISIYPTFTNYLDLGVILTNLGEYPQAIKAYNQGLRYGQYSLIYNDLGALTLLYGNPTSDTRFFIKATTLFPTDARLWTYLAIQEEQYNDPAAARSYIAKAAHYGKVSPVIYDNIMDNHPFTLNLAGKSIAVR